MRISPRQSHVWYLILSAALAANLLGVAAPHQDGSALAASSALIVAPASAAVQAPPAPQATVVPQRRTVSYSPHSAAAAPAVVQGAGTQQIVAPLATSGAVWAWGSNSTNQLGTTTGACGSSGACADSAVPVSGLATAIAVAGGYQHSLAVQSDGSVRAWGYNGNGQLGDGTTTQRTTPITVQNVTNALGVAAGYNHSLAVDASGHIWGWGDNNYGEVGNGVITSTPQLSPVQLSGFNAAVTQSLTRSVIAAGSQFSLAIKNDGSVWGWGYDGNGQLGNGTTSSTPISAPVAASGLSGVVAVAAGTYHGLALKSDGSVWAWGYNGNGQLGNGTSGGNISTPFQIASLSNVTAIAAGYAHSLALRSDGTVWAWGDNSYGEVGGQLDDTGDGASAGARAEWRGGDRGGLLLQRGSEGRRLGVDLGLQRQRRGWRRHHPGRRHLSGTIAPSRGARTVRNRLRQRAGAERRLVRLPHAGGGRRGPRAADAAGGDDRGPRRGGHAVGLGLQQHQPAGHDDGHLRQQRRLRRLGGGCEQPERGGGSGWRLPAQPGGAERWQRARLGLQRQWPVGRWHHHAAGHPRRGAERDQRAGRGRRLQPQPGRGHTRRRLGVGRQQQRRGRRRQHHGATQPRTTQWVQRVHGDAESDALGGGSGHAVQSGDPQRRQRVGLGLRRLRAVGRRGDRDAAAESHLRARR